jgi:hypothetical protein
VAPRHSKVPPPPRIIPAWIQSWVSKVCTILEIWCWSQIYKEMGWSQKYKSSVIIPAGSKELYVTLTVSVYCTVLYCTLLYLTVLNCTVLYWVVLYCTVLYGTVLYWLYCTVLYCIITSLFEMSSALVYKYYVWKVSIEHRSSPAVRPSSHSLTPFRKQNNRYHDLTQSSSSGLIWSSRVLEKLSYSRNSPPFMEPVGSVPCSQQLATCPCPEPDESNQLPSVLFL